MDPSDTGPPRAATLNERAMSGPNPYFSVYSSTNNSTSSENITAPTMAPSTKMNLGQPTSSLGFEMSAPKVYSSPYSSTSNSTPGAVATPPSWDAFPKTMNDFEHIERTAIAVPVSGQASSLMNQSIVDAHATSSNSEVTQRTPLPQGKLQMSPAQSAMRRGTEIKKRAHFRFTPSQRVYLEEELAKNGSTPSSDRRKQMATELCVKLRSIDNYYYGRQRGIDRRIEMANEKKKKGAPPNSCTDLPLATMVSPGDPSDLTPAIRTSSDDFSDLHPATKASAMSEALSSEYYDGLPSNPGGDEEQQELPPHKQQYDRNREHVQPNNMHLPNESSISSAYEVNSAAYPIAKYGGDPSTAPPMSMTIVNSNLPNMNFASPEYAVNFVSYPNSNYGDIYATLPTNMTTVNRYFSNSNFTSPANAVNSVAYPNSDFGREFYVASAAPTHMIAANHRGINQGQDIGTHLPSDARFQFPPAMNLQYSMPTYGHFNQNTTLQLHPPSTPLRQVLPNLTSNTYSQPQVSSSPLSGPSTASTYTEFFDNYSSPLANPYAKKQEEKAQAGHDMSEHGIDLFNIGKTQRGVYMFGDEVSMHQQEENMLSGRGNTGKTQQRASMFGDETGMNQQGENMLSGSGKNQQENNELPSSGKKQQGELELSSSGMNFQAQNEPSDNDIVPKRRRQFDNGVNKAPRKKTKVDNSTKTPSVPNARGWTAKRIKEEKELAERFKRQCAPTNNSYQEQRLQCLLMNHLQGELQIDPQALKPVFAPDKVTEQLVYCKSLPIEDLCLDYFGLTSIPGLKHVNISIYVWKDPTYESEATMYRVDALAVCFDIGGKVIEAMFGDKCKGLLTIGWDSDDDPRAFDFADMTFEELLQLLRRTAIRDFDEEGNAKTPEERERREEQLDGLVFGLGK